MRHTVYLSTTGKIVYLRSMELSKQDVCYYEVNAGLESEMNSPATKP